ncbi:MAG TPA: hypothetical protein VFB32_02825 [Rudaea sp.]|nr:hypothetical protein [Rudaea sp.]
MRQLFLVMCVAVGCAYASLAGAGTSGPPLAFTIDLLGPCTANGCSGTHPTDIGISTGANSFTYDVGTGSNQGAYVATSAVTSPVVCDEIASNSTLGPATTLRMAPAFTNASPGGLLEFGAGGPSVVDLNAISYDGATPPGVATSYSNFGGTLPPQVVCYQINPVSGGAPALAVGPYGIFNDSFETPGHVGTEPWVSVQTVVSPSSGGAAKPVHVSGVTPANALGYVVVIHNASTATGWRVKLGYDMAFFDAANNGGTAPIWCVLGSGVPQPGPVDGSATCNNVGTTHTIGPADIQAGNNSVYIYVQNIGSTTATSNWSTLSAGLYPAVAAIFPPFGTYPQRFDDKVAVASANNLPTLNVGSIVCNNDTVSTSCSIRDQDGGTLPGALVYANTISGGGTANVDPLVYLVDPNSDSTLPGNVAADAITVSNLSCSDPNGILATPLSNTSFATSSQKQGALKLGFGFTPSGSPDYPYVSGTATCTATFSAQGYAPALSSTQSFTITMQQASVASVGVVATPSQTATPGGTLSYTLNVANAASAVLSNVGVNNALPTNAQSMSWTCTPAGGATCPAASGNSAISQSVPSLPVGGSLSYAITLTLAGTGSFAPAAQVTDGASITVPGGSCSGGNCSASASVPTAPLIQFSLQQDRNSYTQSGDVVNYTITIANVGGTDATGLTLANPAVAGLSFGGWTCTPTGSTSSCPNPSGTGAINESAIAVAAGGNVIYALQGTVNVTSGNITDTATVGPGGTICLGSGCTAQQTLTGP